MMTRERIESILAADCGSVFSRVTLIDKVEGEYRFIAVGEALTTPRSLAEGLTEAVKDLEAKTGRRLLRDQSLIVPGNSDGGGVDIAVVAASAGRPLRLITAGLSPAQSSSDALAAAAGAVAEVVASLCIQDIRDKERAKQKLEEIQMAQADAVLLVAGSGARDNSLLAELGEFLAGAKLMGNGDSKLPVVVAGNQACFDAINGILGAVMDLQPAEPIRTDAGSLRINPASSALNSLYLSQSILPLPGLKSFAGEMRTDVISTPKALEMVAQFMARQAGTNVLAIDLGGSMSTIVAVEDSQSSTDISTDCGMGRGIHAVLAGDAGEIAGWLPFEAGIEQVMAVGFNKGLRPYTVAQLPEELSIEEAIARTAIKRAARRIKLRSGLLLATGGFLSHLPRPGRVMLLLLDAIQPHGVISVAYDPLCLLPSLGAVAAACPQAAGEVIMKDALQWLGTAVCLVGSGKEGQPAAQVTVRAAGGGDLKVTVPYGEIEVIPLPPGRKANLVIQPSSGFQLGDRPRGRRVEVEVSGGEIGIVIDARGRPVALPSDPSARIGKLSKWYAVLDI